MYCEVSLSASSKWYIGSCFSLSACTLKQLNTCSSFLTGLRARVWSQVSSLSHCCAGVVYTEALCGLEL